MGMADSISGRLRRTCSSDRSGDVRDAAQQSASQSEVRRSNKVGVGIHGFAMVITEIFKSIQGEGTRAGLPCIFVRLTGCNLRCTWCDIAYAFHGGSKMSIEEVLARVEELSFLPAHTQTGDDVPSRNLSLVELTGGEPLLQPEVIPLSQKLLDTG